MSSIRPLSHLSSHNLVNVQKPCSSLKCPIKSLRIDWTILTQPQWELTHKAFRKAELTRCLCQTFVQGFGCSMSLRRSFLKSFPLPTLSGLATLTRKRNVASEVGRELSCPVSRAHPLRTLAHTLRVPDAEEAPAVLRHHFPTNYRLTWVKDKEKRNQEWNQIESHKSYTAHRQIDRPFLFTHPYAAQGFADKIIWKYVQHFTYSINWGFESCSSETASSVKLIFCKNWWSQKSVQVPPATIPHMSE